MLKKSNWGPAQWVVLHSFAVTYEPSMANIFKAYVMSMAELLPCPQCREHFKKNIKSYPIDPFLKDNHSLFFWTYLIHDSVNRMLGKVSPPYDIVKMAYFRIPKIESI